MIVADSLRVRLSGDLVGDYVVEERLAGGRIVLVPEADYPAVLPARPGRPATPAEFDEQIADLPTDDEP